MVILFVNENGTAEKAGINQINPQNIEYFYASFVKAYQAISSADKDLSAVHMSIQFVTSLCKI